jgi:hypothetical protein
MLPYSPNRTTETSCGHTTKLQQHDISGESYYWCIETHLKDIAHLSLQLICVAYSTVPWENNNSLTVRKVAAK